MDFQLAVFGFAPRFSAATGTSSPPKCVRSDGMYQPRPSSKTTVKNTTSNLSDTGGSTLKTIWSRGTFGMKQSVCVSRAEPPHQAPLRSPARRWKSRSDAGTELSPNELLINLIPEDWKWGKRNFDENYVHVLWQAHKHCSHDKFSYIFFFFFKTWHNCISANSNFYSPGFGDLSLGDIMERIIAWWLHKQEMCCQAAVWSLHLASEMIDAVSVCDSGNHFYYYFFFPPR